MVFKKTKTVDGLKRALRSGVAALAVAGMLVGLNGGFAPPAALAVSNSGNGDNEPACLPPVGEVRGTDAELLGNLRVSAGAVVGLESIITMQGAQVRLPSPKCDGLFIDVPFTHTWSVSGRPIGGTASLTQATGFTPRLVPNKAGTWQVTFTACPSGCRVTTPGPKRGATTQMVSVTIPRLTKTVSLNAVQGGEIRVSSDFLDSTLKLLLAGSRIQISHTGAGTRVAGLSSFIDFGPTAEGAGAPPFVPLPIAAPEVDVPTSFRAIILALQGPLALIDGQDIDRVRLLANNINLELSRLGRWNASINNGLNLSLSFDTNHPSIKCEAHVIERTFGFKTGERWSDTLCPDFDLSTMDLSVTLVPAVANGALTLSGADVNAHLVPQGLKTEVVDALVDATSRLESGIATKTRAKLLESQTSAGVGALLTGVLKRKFSEAGRLLSSDFIGNEWVVRYENKPPVLSQ